MNNQLEDYTRQKIKEGLLKLPKDCQKFFKRMYSSQNLELPVNEVVDNMPGEKLGWALTQVKNTLNRKGLE